MRYLLPVLFLVVACGPEPETAKIPATGPVAETKVPVPQVEEPVRGDEQRFESVTVYYRHPLVEGLLPRTKRIYRHPDMAKQIMQLIDHLSIAPTDGYGLSLWPANAYVREIYLLEENLVVIDLDEGFLRDVKVGAAHEQLMVYSLVNSVLSSFSSIEKVHLLIMGEVRETFLGHIDIEYPLTQNMAYTVIPDELANERLLEEDLEEGRVTQQANKNREDLN